jgi:hypothetical protein
MLYRAKWRDDYELLIVKYLLQAMQRIVRYCSRIFFEDLYRTIDGLQVKITSTLGRSVSRIAVDYELQPTSGRETERRLLHLVNWLSYSVMIWTFAHFGS